MNLKKYQCHKKVDAAKITRVEFLSTQELGESEINPDGAMLYYDESLAPISVSQAYVEKHNPEIGGYFVQYEDGYQSFSPADAFESGYALIGGFEQRLLKERDDLKANVMKLGAFLDSDKVDDVSPKHHQLLSDQLMHMDDYSEVLEKRIALLEVAEQQA